MKNYLKKNLDSRIALGGANTPNVNEIIFKLQGRILQKNNNLTNKRKKSVVLDFGCAQGANVNFFHLFGYDTYGVDFYENDIDVAKKRYPYISHKFTRSKPDDFNLSSMLKYTEGKKISLIVGNLSMMYFDKEDFKKLLKCFYNSLEPNGLIFSTMVSTKHHIFKNTIKTKDEYLRKKVYPNQKSKDHYLFFCKDENDIISKFSIFDKIMVGSSYLQFDTSDINIDHIYTYLGKKK